MPYKLDPNDPTSTRVSESYKITWTGIDKFEIFELLETVRQSAEQFYAKYNRWPSHVSFSKRANLDRTRLATETMLANGALELDLPIPESAVGLGYRVVPKDSPIVDRPAWTTGKSQPAASQGKQASQKPAKKLAGKPVAPAKPKMSRKDEVLKRLVKAGKLPRINLSNYESWYGLTHEPVYLKPGYLCVTGTPVLVINSGKRPVFVLVNEETGKKYPIAQSLATPFNKVDDELLGLSMQDEMKTLAHDIPALIEMLEKESGTPVNITGDPKNATEGQLMMFVEAFLEAMS